MTGERIRARVLAAFPGDRVRVRQEGHRCHVRVSRPGPDGGMRHVEDTVTLEDLAAARSPVQMLDTLCERIAATFDRETSLHQASGTLADVRRLRGASVTEQLLAAACETERGALVEDVRRVLTEQPLYVRQRDGIIERVRYRTLDGQEHDRFPHTAACQQAQVYNAEWGVVCCACRPPFCWDQERGAFVQRVAPPSRVFPCGPRAEVDYARDLADVPTFAEALAALEARKARRVQEQAE